ncbi:hypothetical protein IJ182_11495, partial [bacterium]|nr:hypothetical protein [bacterium]
MQNEGFLKQVARKIFETEKNNMHNVMVLFPNRRAIRFFFEYLKQYSDSDSLFFVPEIFSIDEMVVRNLTDIQKGDNLELLYLLYTVYCEVMSENNANTPSTSDEKGENSKETFDDFYFWGNVILSDFDQIDKELVDAKALFRNLQDYKDLQADPTGYLTKDQIDLINRLFNTSLGNDNLSMRKNFVKIWNCLYDIYSRFNSLLDEKHLAYSGKMYREFATRLKKGEINLSCEKIKIIGFSVLNNVESKIFRLLRENYTTDFYWDYDEYYLNDQQNEAGIFIRENLKLFAQSEDLKEAKFDNIATNSQVINIISSPYETTSLAYIEKWLKEIEQSKNNDTDNEFKFSKVAIVLNDESLVPLVIKSLPVDYKDKVNITMGYPLNQTWLYGEVLEKLNKLADKNEFSQEDVFNVIKEIADNISQGEKHENLWQIAVLKKICNTLLKFIEVIEKIDKQNLSAEIVKNVLKKELSSLNVDIISDGIGGVQLMGMLETRALDFDYILMLSANDDNLPDISKDTSFIPYSFRKAYNMMNADRKAGVFAYYFYRLLHHAKRVDYVYTTVGSENKLKEKSRFIRQIETEFKELKNTDKQINYKNLTAVKTLRGNQREYYFDINEMKFINNGTSTLSPSALNNLIHCQQKFYLNNVRFLREEIEDDKYLA